MGRNDTRWITNLDTLVSHVLSSPHIVIGQLKVKFRLPSDGDYFDMSYKAIQKFEPLVLPWPEVFFRISTEQYLMLMRRIGDSQNVESTCLQYLSPSDELDSVFPGLFLSCGEGFTKLCEALCTNSTMSTLQIQLSGKAPDVLALSQAFDTNISSQSQVLTMDTGENRIMEVAIVMKVAIEEFAIMLHCNKGLQTIQIQSAYNSDQDWVKLVRPLTKDLDVQQANVDCTKLNLALLGARISIGVCAYICHMVLQSSTLREFTIEMTSDYYDHWLKGVPICRWIRALIRPLIVDGDGNLTKLTLAIKGFQVPSQVVLVRPLIAGEDGQRAKVDLTKLNLTVQGGRTSTRMCDLIFHELLQSSTLRELTVETLDHYGDLLEGTPSYKLIRALVRSLIANAKGPRAHVHTLTKLKLADEGFQNQVVLVQPLTLDSNCGHTKLNVKFCGSGMSAAVYYLVFHVVLQSSTLKELTVQISGSCCDVLDVSPRCALVQALVRTLIGGPEGQKANVTLAKLNLADETFQNQVVLVRPPREDNDAQEANLDLTKLNVTVSNCGMSAAICDLIFHEVLQSSTLKEFTVENSNHYGNMVEGSPSCTLIRALVRSMIVDTDSPQANVTFTQLNLADEGFQDQVTLVRPLTTDSDGQQANVDIAKLNVTFSGCRMSGAVCDLLFHEVLQSSTLKELTVETLDHCADIDPSCALLQALVRPLIVEEDGQQAKANLTRLTLALSSARVYGSSHPIFAEILPVLLQRNSTLKELKVKAPHFYELREEMREEKLCALLQSLKENKSLEILDLSDCQGILTQRVIPTLMDILLVNFTLRDINFGDSSIWYGVKEQLRKNEKYMQSCLRKLPVAKAQAARVFLCGGPYAGMCHGIGVILHMLCLT
jgi:hypothetical protein